MDKPDININNPGGSAQFTDISEDQLYCSPAWRGRTGEEIMVISSSATEWWGTKEEVTKLRDYLTEWLETE